MQTQPQQEVERRPRRGWWIIGLTVLALAAIGVGVWAIITANQTDDIVEVTFDGGECTVGATELPPGDHALVLTDVSDLDGVKLHVRNLVDGHTFQDALDAEKEAGGPGSPRAQPSWTADVMPDSIPPKLTWRTTNDCSPYLSNPGAITYSSKSSRVTGSGSAVPWTLWNPDSAAPVPTVPHHQ